MKLGKVSGNILKRSILNQIRTKRTEITSGAGVGVDCATFEFFEDTSEQLPVVSCMQEAVLQVEGDENSEAYRTYADSGEYALSMSHLIQKCVNNLAAANAEPVAVMLSLLLPSRIEEMQLKKLMAEAEGICSAYHMQIAGGQTRVTDAVNMPVATVIGYGKLLTADRCGGKVKSGQDIVVSKWIGLEGTSILAKNNREELGKRYSAYLIDEAAGFDRFLSILPEAKIAGKFGVAIMHDASEGGIFATLWELAERAGMGLTIDLKKLPLRQETVEVCEQLNRNPYELLSGGCLVMLCEDGDGLVDALAAEQIPATVVGRITDSNDRLILNEEEVRYMDRPKQDALLGK